MRNAAGMVFWLGLAGAASVGAAPGCIEVKQETRDALAGDVPTGDDVGEDVSGDDVVGAETNIGDADGDADEGDVPSNPCDPPIEVSLESLWLEVGSSVRVQVGGADGKYQFETGSAGTDLSVSAGENGLFEIATTDASVPATHRVVFSAGTCEGSATVIVNVVRPFQLNPSTIRIPLQTSFTYAPVDGSGEFSFELETTPSCGQSCAVTATGAFTSDKVEGEFHVNVTDIRTGRSVQGTVIVAEDAALVATHRYRVLPPGWYGPSGIEGGSGDVEFQLSPAAPFELDDDGSLTATGESGSAVLTATDRWTRATIAQYLEIAERSEIEYATTPPVAPQWSMVSADINGDGWLDVVVGLPEHTSKRTRSGMVQVYLGTETGLAQSQSQIIESHQAGAQFGFGLALADIVGDANIDLLVGAPGARDEFEQVLGMVAVHRGRGDGRFDESPELVLRGTLRASSFGTRVAVCDVNADGKRDIVVTAPRATPTSPPSSAVDRGALYVFLGNAPNPPPLLPSLTRFSVEGAGNTWSPPREERLEMGHSLAVGDINGDGACEIALGSPGVLSNAGRLWLYRGVSGGTLEGAISLNPVWTVPGAFPRARLGSALAMGDMDRDGDADILVSEPGWGADGANPDATGRVLLIPGSVLRNAFESGSFPTTLAGMTAFRGSNSNDAFGTTLAVANVTGDVVADLIVGAPRGQGVGEVKVFAGSQGAQPSTTAVRSWNGRSTNDQLGVAVAPLGKVGERETEPQSPRVAAFAGASSTWGPSAGGLFDLSVSGNNQSELTEVPVLIHPSPWGIGQGIAVLPDLDADGHSELWIGAPTAPVTPTNQTVSLREGGRVFWQQPWQTPLTPPENVPFGGPISWLQPGDRFGHDIAWVGNFNGIGGGEVAVLVRFGSYPATPPAGWIGADSSCRPEFQNAGAVLLFSADSNGRINTQRPSTVLFPKDTNVGLERVLGIGDFNGDGLADVMATAPSFSQERGRVFIWYGRVRTASDSNTVVICGEDHGETGEELGGRFGASAVALGQADADSCHDVAVGAPGAQAGNGSVFIIVGHSAFGDTCRSQLSRIFRTGPDGGGGRFGHMLSAENIGGGAGKELLVGAPHMGNTSRGEVLLVSDSRVREIIDEGYLLTGPVPFIPLSDINKAPVLRISGSVAGEKLGSVVGLVPQSGSFPPIVIIGRQNVDGADGWADVTLRFHDALLLPAESAAMRAWDVATQPRGVMSLGVHHADELVDVKIVPWSHGSGGVVIAVPNSSYDSVDMGAVFLLQLEGWRALFSVE